MSMDEAERFSYQWNINRPMWQNETIDSISEKSFAEGYRAGQASKEPELKKAMDHEAYLTNFYEGNDKEYAVLRKENERLTMQLRMLETSENRRLAELDDALNAEKLKTHKLMKLLLSSRGTVVTYQMQTYSRLAAKLVDEIDEAINNYNANNESGNEENK